METLLLDEDPEPDSGSASRCIYTLRSSDKVALNHSRQSGQMSRHHVLVSPSADPSCVIRAAEPNVKSSQLDWK